MIETAPRVKLEARLNGKKCHRKRTSVLEQDCQNTYKD